jgi:hypothetical protein
MNKMFSVLGAVGALCLGACANTAENQTDLEAAFDTAAAVETAYASSPSANPTTVKEANALLSSARAALITWQSAPSGSTTEATALSAAIAALVAFEAQVTQVEQRHSARDCDPTDPLCDDGVHRGLAAQVTKDCDPLDPACDDGVHRG